ncbi:MAG: hypothetical protein QW434_06880 [Pyrobaculum sp.]|nr:hypothetical protein [Pyrobaculum sp.]
MTEVKVEQRVEEISPEERRWAVALLVLGIVSVLGIFLGPAAFASGGEGGGGRLAVWGVGVNGSFWVEAAPGSLVVFEVPFCNYAERPAAVWARLAEVPEGIRVFAVYINGSFFGVKWGNWSEWRGVIPPGTCLPARVEIVIDAKVPADRTLRVAAVLNSTFLG